MKTTIELPDDLARQAKSLAHDQGTSLRELVIAGLRGEVRSRLSGARVDFSFQTFSGDGLVADLTAQQVIERSYDA